MTRCQRSCAAFAVMAVVSIGAAQAKQAASQAPVRSEDRLGGDAEAGQRLYTRYGCYQCHGREGQGNPETGPRLGPNPVALEAFTRYVRAPLNQMPPYSSKVLSDDELRNIHAFLRTRAKPAPLSVLPKD